jgi:uncharacterized protein
MRALDARFRRGFDNDYKRCSDENLLVYVQCFHGNRISVRFEYESRDANGQWWRSHGNEHWEFAECGKMARR